MHQTKKGNQWHFGMKAHVGVDTGTRLVHPVTAIAANVTDCTMLPALLHGDETAVWSNQACQRQVAAMAAHAPKAEDRTCRRWRSKLQAWPGVREANRLKSQIRSRVEHIFAPLKQRFGLVKVRYRGLAKDLHRLHTSFALIHRITAQRFLAASGR